MTFGLNSALVGVATGRPVTMPDVVNRTDPIISDLSISPLGVLGTEKMHGQAPALMLWGKGGARKLADGSIGAVSPNGRWLLYLSGADWTLKDLKSGLERHFTTERPATAFTGPPSWSSDSHYVAAHFELPDSPGPSATALKGGVRAIVWDASGGASIQHASAHLNPHLLIWDVDAPLPEVSAFSETEAYSGSWRTVAGAHTYIYAMGEHAYGGEHPFTKIRARTVETDHDQVLYRVETFNQSTHPRVSPDGRTLAFAIDTDTPSFGVANSAFALDFSTNAVRRLTHDVVISDLQWDKSGDLFATGRNGGLQSLERIGFGGGVQALILGTWNRRGLVSSSDEDSLVYTGEDGYGRKAVLRWTPAGGERVLQLINDPTKDFDLGAFDQVSWTTPDGVRLNGFLIKPRGFTPTKQYPLLVDVHGGGPNTPLLLFSLFGWLSQTPLEWHAWAALGYVVFVPDYRSSGEYGEAINRRRAAVKVGDDTGILKDAGDVDTGVRWLLSQGWVDPKRITLFGQSAGGGRVNALLTQSRLYAAGVIHDPIASGPEAEALRLASLGLPSRANLAGLTAPERRRALGGFLFDGWRSKTPTLIMVGDTAHGALDPTSAETLYSVLAGAGVPTKLIHYLDDGHEPATPESALDRFQNMKAWMDRFAGGASPERGAQVGSGSASSGHGG